jgi:hypothetical protein
MVNVPVPSLFESPLMVSVPVVARFVLTETPSDARAVSALKCVAPPENVIVRPLAIAWSVTVPETLATSAAVTPSTVIFPFAKLLDAEPTTRLAAVIF